MSAIGRLLHFAKGRYGLVAVSDDRPLSIHSGRLE